MKKLLLLLLLILPHCVSSQIITSYAGNGIIGSVLGDGGPATSAEIGTPYGLNLDDTGNLLICQQDLVRKVNKSTNIISTVAGSDTATSSGHGGDGGQALAALIYSPFFVCVDRADNYYIADHWYSEVRKVDIFTGIIDTFAGNRTVGSLGNGGPAKSAELTDPFSLCFDPTQHYLYISNEFGYSVRKVDVATDTITAFAGTGVNGYSGDGGLAINAKFSILYDICSDSTGNIYIGDWGNKRVRKVDAATGIVTTIAGTGIRGYSGDGGPATSAMISAPYALCFDKCGNLYFSDSNRVRRIDGITSVITTIAGNGTAGFSGDSGPAINAELFNPVGIAIDSSGNLYISDQGNNRVRKVTIFNPFIKISSSSGGAPICSGYPITIQATWAGGGDTPSFQWSVNGSVAATTGTGSYTYVPANGDLVSCMLTSSSACVGTPTVVSNTLSISTDTLTVPAISISGITAAATGTIVTLTATVTNAGSSYNIKWFNNGLLFSTTTTPTVTYTKAAGTDNITARVFPLPTGTVPTCYDSTTSAVHTVTVTPTGVNTLTAQQLHIYPNPVNDVLHIDGVGGSNSLSAVMVSSSNQGPGLPAGRQGEVYKLFSIVGAELKRGILIKGNNSISIASLPKGIYILEVVNNEGQKTVTKIVRQ